MTRADIGHEPAVLPGRPVRPPRAVRVAAVMLWLHTLLPIGIVTAAMIAYRDPKDFSLAFTWFGLGLVQPDIWILLVVQSIVGSSLVVPIGHVFVALALIGAGTALLRGVPAGRTVVRVVMLLAGVGGVAGTLLVTSIMLPSIDFGTADNAASTPPRGGSSAWSLWPLWLYAAVCAAIAIVALIAIDKPASRTYFGLPPAEPRR